MFSSMKVSYEETDEEFKLIREKPYKDLVSINFLILLGVLFVLLLFIKLFIAIPIIVLLVALASIQTLEDHFIVVINKRTKNIKIFKYYVGIWKFREYHYDANEFESVEIEKKVTTIREDGRFSINLIGRLDDPNDIEKKGEAFTLMSNMDMEALDYAKTIAYILGLRFNIEVKYKAGLN